jgi:hypothetical protein
LLTLQQILPHPNHVVDFDIHELIVWDEDIVHCTVQCCVALYYTMLY